jgi:hypothetical protein
MHLKHSVAEAEVDTTVKGKTREGKKKTKREKEHDHFG